MSIGFGSRDDEDCYDVEAFRKRNFPADKIIQIFCDAAKQGICIDEVTVDKRFYEELENQMGGYPRSEKNAMFIYGPQGRVKVSKGE